MHPPHPLRFLSLARWLLVGVLAGGVLLAAASTASAAVDLFIKFSNGQGSYAGESSAAGRTGWSNLRSVGFSATSPITATTTTGKPTFSPVSVEKSVDRLSPTLFYDLAAGLTIPADSTGTAVTIEYSRPINGSTAGQVFMRVELKSVYVTSQTGNASADDEGPVETLQLNYGAIRITYYPQNADGTLGTPVVSSWSITSGGPTY